MIKISLSSRIFVLFLFYRFLKKWDPSLHLLESAIWKFVVATNRSERLVKCLSVDLSVQSNSQVGQRRRTQLNPNFRSTCPLDVHCFSHPLMCTCTFAYQEGKECQFFRKFCVRTKRMTLRRSRRESQSYYYQLDLKQLHYK